MDYNRYKQIKISSGPCPPEEFAGRFVEKQKLLDALSQTVHQGQVIVITGARGSGKTSFLDWAEYEIQNRHEGLKMPAIKKEFLETPGMVFTTYRNLLNEIRGYKKFGWFEQTLNKPNVKKSIKAFLSVIEITSSLAGPAAVPVKAGVTAARHFLPAENIEYSNLLTTLLEVFRSLSDELKDNKYLVILCDDAQWSSRPDFQLLKDLIRNLPPGIAFIITFRLETESMSKYAELRQELIRYNQTEIRLSAMTSDGIKDFALQRLALSIDTPTAKFLDQNIGDPLCLVSCFNLLQKLNLEPNPLNIKGILPEALNPVRCIYSDLDQEWQKRVNKLCILRPPLPLSLVACMLKIEMHDLDTLQDELDQSTIFKRMEPGIYDFAYPSLREYRRKELPQDMKTLLYSQAASCMEALENDR